MRRVRRPTDKEEVFDFLTKQEGKLNFHTYKDVFMLAACLGYSDGGSPAEFSKTLEPISWDIFSLEEQCVLKMIALAETGDPKILVEGDDQGNAMLEIVEGYANLGLGILKRKVVDQASLGSEKLDAIVEIIMSPYKGASDGDGDILSKIIQ